MSEFMRCTACMGKKIILGMGCIEKKCEPCLGVGYVKDEARTEDKDANEVVAESLSEMANIGLAQSAYAQAHKRALSKPATTKKQYKARKAK